MKCILISSKITKDKFNTLNHVIENDWIKYFSKKKVKLLPININSFNFKDLSFFKPMAVIISGGNDIKKINKSETNICRDKNDDFLYKYALKKKIPTLAVCHGFHFIAQKLGAKVVKIKRHVRKNHTISLKGYHKDGKKIKVNSYHNYGIYNLPKIFNFSAYCSDGSIEFAEIKKDKTLCLMFHPERKNISQREIDKIVFKHLKI